MTATAVDPPQSEVVPTTAVGSRWRKAAVIMGSLVLVAAAGGGLWFWHYAATYAPLQSGFSFGPYRSADDRNIVQRQTDLGGELYLRGRAGTEAAVITQLGNDGSHDVTVQRVARGYMIAKVQWSPYVVRAGGNIAGVALPLRPFPATVPAHGQIRVVVTLRKPPCNGTISTFDQLPVYWHALGVHHVYDWTFSPFETIVDCPLHAH